MERNDTKNNKKTPPWWNKTILLIPFAACAAFFSTPFAPVEDSNQAHSDAPTSFGHKRFHQSGFGGIYNINHPAGARARRKLSEENVIIPTSANSFATPSLSEENIQNFHGHYVHDEHRSPFASFLYNKTKDELEAEQKDYVRRMNKIREEWGAWNFHDEHPEIRPIADLDAVPYRDMKNSDFPAKAWQMDEKYVKDFISEGKKLVTRVKEGIYAEYGHPTKALKTQEEIDERDKMFEVIITDETPKYRNRDPLGWALINRNGFDMYAKKLLHSMMTNDEFYYVMGGHSAAAGHGNNFHQTYLMEFANIMEPVLHKLGVRLIARNLAMGGLGTSHFSMGANTLYGETDVMMWDSEMTEKASQDQDLFHKQVMLGGERFPVLIGGQPSNLNTETGGNLWYGIITENFSGVPRITSMEQAETVPWAAQEFVCDKEVKDLCGRGLLDECWVPRSDYTPTTKQQAHVGGKAGWHPGYRTHKYNARKQIMIMLRALDRAFEMWEEGIGKEFPLKEDYWHVGETYHTATSNLSNYINGEGRGKSPCEQRFGKAPMPNLDKVCRMSMKGMTEFTPRARSNHNSIRAHLKPAPNGYKPDFTFEALYEGVDVLPPEWKVPEGEVDVHAIAIASTYDAPELDQTWVDKNNEDAEEAQNSRRMLRKAATEHIEVSDLSGEDSRQGEIAEGSVAGSEVRELTDDAVVPGIGWFLQIAGQTGPGYCDGSPVSWCKRTPGNKCLMYEHNDGRNCLVGDALSGWLVVNIPDVKEGFIFARLQWWHPRNNNPATKGWTEVNNGVHFDNGRHLKPPPKEWPEDFHVDIAINGKIVKTYNGTEFRAFSREIAYNEAFYPLMDDKELASGDGDVELGFRIRSEIDPRDAALAFTHIYYA